MKTVSLPLAIPIVIILAGLSMAWAQHDHQTPAGLASPATIKTTANSFAFQTRYVSTRWPTCAIICLRCRKYSYISAWGTTTLPPKLRNPASECHHLVCMARPRWPSICHKECRMLGRPCTVLLVGLRWQPKIQESPVIQSQYFLGWRTSQLSALAVTPDTVCNRSR